MTESYWTTLSSASVSCDGSGVRSSAWCATDCRISIGTKSRIEGMLAGSHCRQDVRGVLCAGTVHDCLRCANKDPSAWAGGDGLPVPGAKKGSLSTATG